MRKAVVGFNNTYKLNRIVNSIVQQNVRSEMLMFSIRNNVNSGISDREANLTVSLTTYGKRIYDVHLVIESLLSQTLKPKKIILWLDENEFNGDTIPLVLKKQQARGLEIDYYHNIKSYTKLIPTLQKYPGETIVTVDDDIMYPFDLIENLYKSHLENPHCVICGRCHKVSFKGGKILPYNRWQLDYNGSEASVDLLPTGVGGVLYPQGCFHDDITREDLFMKLAPLADDVWFKAMTLLKDTPCKKVYVSDYIDLSKHQDMALSNINVKQNYNDTQITQTFNHYDLWEKLKK